MRHMIGRIFTQNSRFVPDEEEIIDVPGQATV